MSEWDFDAFGSAYIILIMLLSELRLWTEHLMSIFLSEWVIMCSIAEMSRAAARCIGKATSEETRLNWRSEPTAKESWACLRCSRDPMKHGLPKKTKDDCPRPLDADEKTTQRWEEGPVPPPGHTRIQQAPPQDQNPTYWVRRSLDQLSGKTATNLRAFTYAMCLRFMLKNHRYERAARRRDLSESSIEAYF